MTLHLGDEIRRVLAECRRKRASDHYAATRIAELVWEKSREIVGTFPATLDDCPACQAWEARCRAAERQLAERKTTPLDAVLEEFGYTREKLLAMPDDEEDAA